MTKVQLLITAVLFFLFAFVASMFSTHFFLIPLVPAGEWAALGKVGVWLVSILVSWKLCGYIASLFAMMLVGIFGRRRNIQDDVNDILKRYGR